MTARRYSPADRLIDHLDQGLRTVFGNPPTTGRPHPAANVADGELSDADRHHSAGLMRVNHCGEVCAQALYQGQALTARDPVIRDAMREAADEENDHLAWCRGRLNELDSRTSLLDPAFHLGSLALGAAAGAAGDRWSLGFLAETERQVVRHLSGHLERLPEADHRSRAIVTQMRTDEGEHASMAVQAGARELPAPVKRMMQLTSKVMTTLTYRV
ncbi:2-polyprenyl-3-methyl-6-methoxy-1,4-benzoquinone monooxygenase [Arhodomonas sp. AD133]|uniref:2-polyprenyl-3-methyl-6-methoxy-1,4-benzoquinone monooxygenase n=1 Tax=Arhodomonas sp. AD133 TaxID=3415009 RepID=UPI003EC0F8D7